MTESGNNITMKNWLISFAVSLAKDLIRSDEAKGWEVIENTLHEFSDLDTVAASKDMSWILTCLIKCMTNSYGDKSWEMIKYAANKLERDEDCEMGDLEKLEEKWIPKMWVYQHEKGIKIN